MSSKCKFLLESIEFLGHAVSKESIRVNFPNIQVIRDQDMPTSITELHSFIELEGYYIHFVEILSSIASYLTRLTRLNVHFQLSKECDISFLKVKELLTTTPILTLPGEGEGFTTYCDISNICLGCVLMQQGRVIAY